MGLKLSRTQEQKTQSFMSFYTDKYKGTKTDLRDKARHPFHYIAVRKMEKSLLSSESIMKNVDDLVFIISPKGTALSVSESHGKALGYGPKELEGRPVFDLVHPSDRQKVMKTFGEDIRTGGTSKIEISLLKKDGSCLLVESCGKAITDKKGRVIGGVVINRDITEHRKLEESLASALKESNDANAEMKKFFNILAHDLRSPFNGLLGFLELLKTEMDDLERKEIQAYADNAYRIGKNVLNLITSLLEWSRLKNGTNTPAPSQFDICEIAAGKLALLGPVAGNKGTALKSIVRQGGIVFADPDMTGVVLHNLITNAIKFTQPGGSIEISCSQEGGFVRISVKDNGIGLSQEGLQRLFHLEANYKSSGTANEPGTGLGLQIVKEMVELNGGKIWVESGGEGKGSTFSFTLPAAKEEPAKPT